MNAMNTIARLTTATLLAFSTIVVGAGPVGCDSEEGSGTTGRRIALEVRIGASSEAKQFTNAKGWSVALTKAAIATGAFYFYDGDTLFASHDTKPPKRLSIVRPAFAHPGHYVPGNARGQMLNASSAELLAGGSLGNGDGITGPVRSATFTFSSPATGPAAAELGAGVIVLEGTATKDAETRPFRAEILADEMKDAKGITQIEGCPFTHADMQADGVVTITIKIPMWFDQVDFTEVAKSADGKPVTMVDGLARNQLVRGTKAGLAYTFAYAPR